MPNQIQLLYPTAMELRTIDQIQLPYKMGDMMRIFPIKNVNAHICEWEQQDTYNGLMKPRGLDGLPSRISMPANGRFQVTPGVYGEFGEVTERDVTTRIGYGKVNGPIDVSDLVLRISDKLEHRMVVRWLRCIWDLLLLGRFSVIGPTQAILHQDAFEITNYTPSVLWSTTATATPLADFRAIQLSSRGTSNEFDEGSEAWMNRKTWNYIAANTNTADIYGKRTNGLANVMSLEEANMLLTKEGLPNIRVFDKTYLDDFNAQQLFIYEGMVSFQARRDNGAPIGQISLTRCAENPDAAPGTYYKIEEKQKVGEPYLKVHRGGNWALEIHYPTGLVSAKVA